MQCENCAYSDPYTHTHTHSHAHTLIPNKNSQRDKKFDRQMQGHLQNKNKKII